MSDFGPYLPLIFISHAKIRVFSRLSKHSWGKSFSRPLFLAFRPRGRVGFLADEART